MCYTVENEDSRTIFHDLKNEKNRNKKRVKEKTRVNFIGKLIKAFQRLGI